MDAESFREFGKAAVDYIADYMENIRDCDVLPSVDPGYLIDALPKEMPETPEHWKDVLKDVDHVIKPGLTHWQSPHMHGYYSAASSYPSIVGDMLSNGFNVVGLSWIASPACTELEMIVMDWLAKFFRLPEHFLHSDNGPGGGIIKGSASESILVAMLAAREQAVKRLQETNPEMSESEIRGKLISYSSDQSNYCVEKAAVLAAIKMRLLPVDDDFIFKGEMLEKAVEADLAQGLIPIICIATLGTTGTCAYDDIPALGKICNKHNIWLHVDAAYGGVAFAIDEMSELRNGLELIDSLDFNLHKFLMVNIDCSALWFRDASKVVDSFTVQRLYLQHKQEGPKQMPDFRHWQLTLSRRFRALKVWVTFRTVGAAGLRAHIYERIALAERFEKLVLTDSRFEIVTKRSLGLVCFRPRGDNKRTTDLLQRITDHKKIYMTQDKYRDMHFLRFVVCGMHPRDEDIDFAWREIQTQMKIVMEQEMLTSTSVKTNDSMISQQLLKDLNITEVSKVEKLK